jgi:hypothetical protein
MAVQADFPDDPDAPMARGFPTPTSRTAKLIGRTFHTEARRHNALKLAVKVAASDPMANRLKDDESLKWTMTWARKFAQYLEGNDDLQGANSVFGNEEEALVSHDDTAQKAYKA